MLEQPMSLDGFLEIIEANGSGATIETLYEQRPALTLDEMLELCTNNPLFIKTRITPERAEFDSQGGWIVELAELHPKEVATILNKRTYKSHEAIAIACSYWWKPDNGEYDSANVGTYSILEPGSRITQIFDDSRPRSTKPQPGNNLGEKFIFKRINKGIIIVPPTEPAFSLCVNEEIINPDQNFFTDQV